MNNVNTQQIITVPANFVKEKVEIFEKNPSQKRPNVERQVTKNKYLEAYLKVAPVERQKRAIRKKIKGHQQVNKIKQKYNPSIIAISVSSENDSLNSKLITDIWKQRLLDDDDSFQSTELMKLNGNIQRNIYRVANYLFSKKIILKLRSLNMFTHVMSNIIVLYAEMDKVPIEKSEAVNKVKTFIQVRGTCSGPAIITPIMDPIQVQERLKKFLTDLRKNNLLFTQEEFKSIKSSAWFPKPRQIGRILGRNYASKIIQKLNLQYIKVPQKIAVIDGETDLSTFSLRLVRRRFEPLSLDLKVYAESIESEDRPMTSQEVIELLVFIKASGYNDAHGGNFITASDGVYVIDTKFSSFSDESPYHDTWFDEVLQGRVADDDIERSRAEFWKRIKDLESTKEQRKFKSANLTDYELIDIDAAARKQLGVSMWRMFDFKIK